MARQIGITATEFGGSDDVNASAYGGMVDGDMPEAALPFHFSQPPRIRVYYGDKSCDGDINDVGPWNKTDDYWARGDRPASEAQHANGERAENKRVPSNPAGLDLTPAFFDALGISGAGMAKVDWEFIE